MVQNTKPPYAKIWVHFLTPVHNNPNEVRIGQKAYPYYVTCETIDEIRELYYGGNYGEKPVLQIANSSGYNYHGNEVVVTDYTRGHTGETIDVFYETLSKVTFTGYVKLEEMFEWDEDAEDNLKLVKNTPTTILRSEPKVIYDKNEAKSRLDKELEKVAKMADQSKHALGKLEEAAKYCAYIKADVDSDMAPYGTVNLMNVKSPDYTIGTYIGTPIYNSQGTKIENFDPDPLWVSANPYMTFKNNDSITINEKENNSMFENVFKGFDFGKANSVKTSIYGPAFKCGDCYVSYDKSAENYIDVTELLLDIENTNYKMPIAANAVSVGDYILHMHKWVRVLKVLSGGRLEVEDMSEKQVVTILPIKNVFGFDFYTKLYCFADNLLSGAASAENPFGNILPLMLMSKDNSKDNLLPLMLMGGGFGKDVNPMMVYALMGSKNSDNSLLMMLALSGGNLGFNFPTLGTCNCGCHNDNNNGEDE